MPSQRPSVQTAWVPGEKALPQLPQLPSPTLTNPDHILPSGGLHTTPSPPRFSRRPPSPSYLRDKSSESPSPRARASSTSSSMTGKKEKLGLMSRKMMLLRSRTASGGNVNGHRVSRGSPSQGSIEADFVPSSPILQDVGNLAPEQPEHIDYLAPPESGQRSASRSGSSSSDMSGLAGFLAKYEKQGGISDDEALYDSGESPAPSKFEQNAGIESEVDAQRRKQEQEEYNSAILSKRAEQILANAKKRLNVMEGNLRGARDLVAPLTAANLKRATSLGSAHYSPAYGRRYMHNGYDYENQSQQSPRKLDAQTSSPTLGRDYQGHARGFSEAEIPGRPYTALDNPHYMMSRNVNQPTRGGDAIQAQALRGSRSYDSLGASSGVGYGVAPGRPLHTRELSESNHLEPLQEDDERRPSRNSRGSYDQGFNNGLGIYRPSSRTSDLREQMSSLKGKISNLQQRAREDSLRRQSQVNLRNASPFNNAVVAPPEFFYTSSTSYGNPILDTNAGVGYTSNGNSPPSPYANDNGLPAAGSRNAFAEQAAVQKQHGLQQARVVEIVAPKTPDSKFQVRPAKNISAPAMPTHRRTPSGRVVIDSAKSRYSHHQYNNSASSQESGQGVPRGYVSEDEYLDIPSPRLSSDEDYSSPLSSKTSPRVDDGYAASESEASVYEDAKYEQNPVVAHEDREDAFDYEHFFLHSAMATYNNGRRGSDSSGASVSSVETAKGPALVGDEDDDDAYDQTSSLYPPPTPETPEKLKEIERNLHRRTFSDESTSTLDTFATADEDPVSPIEEPIRRISTIERHVVSPVDTTSRSHSRIDSQNTARASSRLTSRPGTAVRRHVRRDSSSERADSGVGLPRRSVGSNEGKWPPPGSMTPRATKPRSDSSAISTPPMSPPTVSQQDPVAVAVNALLDPIGEQLGLRNKAVLFGVMESMRKVVRELQESDEAGYESRVLRKKLDEAKLALDGRSG